MKNRIILILIILISFAFINAKFLTTAELKTMKEALSVINCSEEDLNFDKKWGEGELLLQPVKDSLDKPLTLPDISERLKNELTETPVIASENTRKILGFESSSITVKPINKFKSKNSDEFINELLMILKYNENIINSLNISNEEKKEFYNTYLGEDEVKRDIILSLNKLPLDNLFLLFKNFYPYFNDIEEADISFLTDKQVTEGDFFISLSKDGNHEYIVGAHPFEIFIDLSGDDKYTYSDDYLVNSFHCILDFSGNDIYLGAEKRGPGSGLFGIGIIIDKQGNDEYLGNDFCFGAGVGGIGVVIDEGGKDLYRANDFCLAAGYFGLGILFDYSDDDIYESSRFSQGFASVKGIGVLSDKKGNDIYITGRRVLHQPLYNNHYQSLSQGFSIGMRGEDFAGGIGLLHDKEGNDKYIGDVYAQGAGYWYALGILFDESGEDVYSAWIYGQGSGIHLASGCLIDLKGNDSYTLNDGVGQGGGHDLAVGFLLDREGNDYYSGSGITQGGGHANGIGILIDSSGNDAYSGVKEIIQGWGTGDRNSCSFGILLDLGGNDKYSTQGKDNFIWFGTKYGVGIDKEN
ncbi:MAG: hypothetical protein PHV06_00190 [bacterium]|nr:hypothetical protein [bacterium]